ncbi:MAG: hypothetical protein Q4A64_05685 [Porphyromonadaceae bacterium]|nr:hypothetical protein [Porphyromonadaceae bacterium]
MYSTVKRNLDRLTFSSLPIDLCLQPTMLLVLLLCPDALSATLIFVGLIAACAYYLWRDGALRVHRASIIYLSAHTALFYALSCLLFIAPTAIHLQGLWLVLFFVFCQYDRLIGHCGRYRREYEDGRCCTQLRGEVLKQEYVRFEHILLYFSLATIALIIVSLSLALPALALTLLASLIALGSIGTLALELVHLAWVKARLDNDYWIPVMDDRQQTIGRVSSTAPHSTLGRLPLVRLIAFTEGMIYLEQVDTCLHEPCYDTPFDTWLQEGQSPHEAAQQMIDQRFCGVKRAKPRQLLHYHTESKGGQPLSVYFFAVELDAPDLLLIDCKPIEGKWWPLAQVQPQLAQKDFSHYLRLELPYLEQTVLLAHQLRVRQQES